MNIWGNEEWETIIGKTGGINKKTYGETMWGKQKGK
jgi:hypothetical protein